MSRVFITGHGGYIGSALYKMLQGHMIVRGYDITESEEEDILNLSALTREMVSFQPTVVIHLAAVSSVPFCEVNPKRGIAINAIGTINVLKAMKAAACEHIIYASSCSVYGTSNKAVNEKDLLKGRSAYALTKLLGEQAIYHYYHNLKILNGNYIIFRMFNVIGGTDSTYDRIFCNLRQGKFTIYGTDYPTKDGTCERDYVSLSDVIRAYYIGITTIASHVPFREIINLSSGSSVSVKEIVAIWEVYRKVKVTIGPRREGDPSCIYGDNTKALHLLNWRPRQNIFLLIRSLIYNNH